MRILNMVARLLAASLLALAQPAFAAQTAAPAPKQQPPIGELPDVARPTAYRLSLEIDPAKADFSGITEIDVETNAPLSRMFLHGNGLRMRSAQALTGRAAPNRARWEQVHPTGVAELVFQRPLAAGRHTLRFRYSAPFMKTTGGLYKVEVGGKPYAWTQFQAIDARRVFPSFDEPRHKTNFIVSVTVPAGLKAFANAAERSATPIGDGRVRHDFAALGPMPTYLVALAVGDFDVVEGVIPANAVRKTALPFRAITTKGQGGRLGITMAETPRLLAITEEWFGTPYPWAKLDVITSPIMGGAMENNGLITFDDTLLLLDADAPPSQLQNMGVVMAHELAHQWFGNGVTPRWWDDIWLNESFAEWMGNLAAARWRPDLGVGITQIHGALGAMDEDSLGVGRPIRQPITDSAQINAAFDSITYEKGGQVIRMMNGFVGEPAFQAGVRLHLRRHWNGTATAGDFFTNIAQGAQNPRMVQAFRSFVDQQGVPLVRFTPGPGGSYILSQQRYRPLGVDTPDGSWNIPVCAASGEGRQCTLLEGPTATLRPVIGTAPWLAGNASGAGYYRFDLAPADWDRLIAAGAALPAAEALTSADSLWAGFTGGYGAFPRIMAAARAFAPHEERLVATFLPTSISDYARRAGSPADRAAAGRFARDLALPTLVALGLDPARGVYATDSADRRQLRVSLATLALEGRDPATSTTLADAGLKSLEGDASAVDPLFRTLAFRAALRRDPALADRLFQAAASSRDALFRRQALRALGVESGPAVLDRVTDERLRNPEALNLIAGQLQNPETRDAALAWVERTFDTSVKPRLGGLLGGFFVSNMGTLCSEDAARRVEAIFRPQMSDLGIGKLELERPLATIRQCAALKAARGAEVEKALAAY